VTGRGSRTQKMTFEGLEGSSMWNSLHILFIHLSVASLRCATAHSSKCQKTVGRVVKIAPGVKINDAC
jgi:hypothetical protein